ncbi:MAG: XRE family transcriptional regulator [Pseudomonadales bacterium]|nr:XRE family transcriptional regulator [Pseudomonadales bacterium]
MLHDRIRRARILQGLSLQQVADQLGDITKQALSKYETAKDVPNSSRLLQMAKVFGVKPEYFFRSARIELGDVDFRRHSTFGKRQQDAVKEQVREHLERYIAIEALFDSIGVDDDFSAFYRRYPTTCQEEAELAAETLRKAWNLGNNPIRNVTETLEEKGVKVISIDAHEKFDGLCAKVNQGQDFIIVTNASRPGERQRFNLAHELGHMVMAIPGSLQGTKEEESLCHRFAGAFLFPKTEVFINFGVSRSSLLLEELILAKREWGISAQAIIRRLHDLSVISQSSYQSIFKQWSIRGYRKDEPCKLPKEESFRMRQLAYRALAEDLITPSRGAELLAVGLAEIERILSNEQIDGEQDVSADPCL